MSHPNTMSRPAPERGGFTLVELVIAFTILLFGIMAVAGMMVTSVAQARRADNLTNSAMAAHQMLDIFATMPYDSVELGYHVDTTPFGPAIYVVEWTVEDVSETMAAGSNEIKRIVLLSGGGLAQERAEVYTLFIYKPGGGS